MDQKKTVVMAVLIGILITLLTGYASTIQLIGGTHFGYPLTWLVERVLAPTYNPLFINYFNFLADVIIWAFLAWVMLDVIQSHAGRNTSGPAAKKSRARRRRR